MNTENEKQELKRYDLISGLKMLDRLSKSRFKPLWVLVPDVVADKDKTLEMWQKYSPTVSIFGHPLAFAAQDGMTPDDVPKNADVVFIGGSTEWKWKYAKDFCSSFQRVHIGRVNTIDRLWLCKEMGAESVDGTGWFRDGEDNHRLTQLESFLAGEKIQLDLDI